MNDLPWQTLGQLLESEGLALCKNPQRCRNLLNDLCWQYPREVNALANALEVGVVDGLLAAAQGVPWEAVCTQQMHRLTDERSFQPEAARWAVEAWQKALAQAGLRPAPPDDEAERRPLQEPKQLFRGLTSFLECGGFDGLQSPARAAAFNGADDSFVALFPGKNRVYRFDLFGALCEKFKSDTAPLAIVWNEALQEYWIGFADGLVRRYSARLEATGEIALPPGLEPRLLAGHGEDLWVADVRQRCVLAVNLSGHVTGSRFLTGPVCQLALAPAKDRLAVGYGQGVAVLRRQGLSVAWKDGHAAPRTAVAWDQGGDLWVGLSTGHLWRLGPDYARLADVPAPAGLHCLTAVEGGVVAGTIKGQLLLYDALGAESGRDELKTPLFQAGAGAGGLLALATGRGVTVVKPSPQAALTARERGHREQALAWLLACEKLAHSRSRLQARAREFLAHVDLTEWEANCAFQALFLLRQEKDPVRYGRIADALRFADPAKAARLCARTTPAIIDGSNVARYHWRVDKGPNRRSRLKDVLAVRDALARWENPVLYPLLMVVDATERQTSDDAARLRRLIAEGEVLETPSRREADALILNLVKQNGWADCRIVTNDNHLYEAHREMLPDLDDDWYRRVQQPFAINPRSGEVYFPERSRC